MRKKERKKVSFKTKRKINRVQVKLKFRQKGKRKEEKGNQIKYRKVLRTKTQIKLNENKKYTRAKLNDKNKLLY